MAVQIWHKSGKRGKRAGAEVAGGRRCQVLDPAGCRAAAGQAEVANGGLQERDLPTVGVDQEQFGVGMVDGDHQPRETAAAADIQPESVPGVDDEGRQLRAVLKVPPLEVGYGARGDQVDRRIPFPEQGGIGREPRFT